MSEFSTVSGATAAASTDRLQYRVGEQTDTAVMLVGLSGDARENNRVFPFGEPWLSFAASNNAEKFTTYQHDGESDLDYAIARYFANRSGRFMTADPGHIGANVADPQSWNAYVYGRNDSINFVDRNGLCPGQNSNESITDCPQVTNGQINITVRCGSGCSGGNGGAGFDFGWWPSFEDWTRSLSKGLVGPATFSSVSRSAGALRAGVMGLAVIASAQLAGDTRQREEEHWSYVIYTKINPRLGQVYIGRTQGPGTPEEVLRARDSNHEYTAAQGWEPAKIRDKRMDIGFFPGYFAMRGREQQVLDSFGGVGDRRVGNEIRAVAKANPLGWVYWTVSNAVYGPLWEYTGN